MSRRKWTSTENEKLAQVVLTDRSIGLTFVEAYKDASSILNRSQDACEVQWRKLKFLYTKELSQLSTKKLTPLQINKKANKVAEVKTTQTNLEALMKSLKMVEKENLTILNSGKGGTEFIVINDEGESGYLVKTENGKVVSCNCPNHHFRQVTCKHIIKVALDKKMEIF